MVGRCWDVVDNVSPGPMKIVRKEMVNSRPMTLGPVNSREVLCVRIAVTEDVVPVVGGYSERGTCPVEMEEHSCRVMDQSLRLCHP